MAVKNVSNCNDLGKSYVKFIDSKARGYGQVRVIFDNYTKESSLKEAMQERRRGNTQPTGMGEDEEEEQCKEQ